MIRKIFCVVAILACRQAVPVAAPAQSTFADVQDLSYGPHERQKLDVFVATKGQGPRPCAVWLHGGAWAEGDKRFGTYGVSVLANMLRDRGVALVACNYRLAPQHRYPAQLDDAQRVVRWVRAHAADYNIDPQRVAAVGSCAGGHLAAMLAGRETREAAHDELSRFSSRVNLAVSINGITDLRAGSGVSTVALNIAVRNLLGEDPQRAAELAADASPITFVTRDSAPMLFIVGDQDTLVPNRQSVVMAEALKQSGVASKVVTFEGGRHALGFSAEKVVRDTVIDYLVDQLKP